MRQGSPGVSAVSILSRLNEARAPRAPRTPGALGLILSPHEARAHPPSRSSPGAPKDPSPHEARASCSVLPVPLTLNTLSLTGRRAPRPHDGPITLAIMIPPLASRGESTSSGPARPSIEVQSSSMRRDWQALPGIGFQSSLASMRREHMIGDANLSKLRGFNPLSPQ